MRVVAALLLGLALPLSDAPRLTSARVPPCTTTATHQRWSMKNRPMVARTIDLDGVVTEYPLDDP